MQKKKKVIYLLIILILAFFIWIKNILNKQNNILDIESIKKSIVIIVPEIELTSYKNNPKWIFDETKTSWIWVWFFIDKYWTIQTVDHIIEDYNINYKVIYKNKKYDTKIIKRNKNKDLAILKIDIDKNGKTPPLFNKEWIIWENIYSFWVNTNNLEIIYNTWILINKKSKLENISNLLEISNELKPGFSWWPIINSKWNVIWINYAISNWKNYWIDF